VDLTGTVPERVMDGRPLLPTALDPTANTARNLLIESLDYKAVRNMSFLNVKHTTGERELYDMRPANANYDPYQLRSRHNATAYEQIEFSQQAILNRLIRCSGVNCN
jgi:hypothetical protein